MSLSEPASVASTSTSCPEVTDFICWAVLTMGIGHDRPRASTVATTVWVVMSGAPFGAGWRSGPIR